MSRSRRKSPASGITTARTEKWWKRIINRKLRHRVQDALNKEKTVLPDIREVSNVWDAPKDGKSWWGCGWDGIERIMRK